jgi:hypothetical protein
VIGGVDSTTGKAPDPSGFNMMTGPISTATGGPFNQTLALLPSCKNTSVTPNSIGRPGLRLADFVSQFGSRGKYYSICDSDYSQALADIGTQLFNAISPCLEGVIDSTMFDPMATGQNLQCTVSDVQNFGSSGQTEMLIPPCTMQAGPSSLGMDMCTTGPCPTAGQTLPCWYVKKNPGSCATTPTNLEIHIPRSSPPAIGTTEVVSCAIAPQ